MNMEQWWNDIFAGETEELGENLPSATLSTTNPTWIDPGTNPGLRGERPATNRLSHGTALQNTVNVFKFLVPSLQNSEWSTGQFGAAGSVLQSNAVTIPSCHIAAYPA
jgi:hypothetical protein